MCTGIGAFVGGGVLLGGFASLGLGLFLPQLIGLVGCVCVGGWVGGWVWVWVWVWVGVGVCGWLGGWVWVCVWMKTQ